MTFYYMSADGESENEGRISYIKRGNPLELAIDANGWNFHIIVGTQANGNFICIPDWNVGSELAGLNDTFWNRERMRNYSGMDNENANAIAEALNWIYDVDPEPWMKKWG